MYISQMSTLGTPMADLSLTILTNIGFPYLEFLCDDCQAQIRHWSLESQHQAGIHFVIAVEIIACDKCQT